MELASAVVRHAGNLGMTIHKEKLTPADLMLLRFIHGNDAVLQITVTHTNAKRDMAKEIERLREFYGVKAFETVFPGVSPVLPTTLEQAGIKPPTEEDEPEVDEDDGAPVAGLPPPAEAVDRARAARRAASMPTARDLVG